ncbi:class III extradiol ring-cleavage dioxygenase [Acinetobacter sp. MD2(2019)]|uniref:DODA-type extradiol aromatic ring-opening family dioxygenase n=1 Tax=Acinetobacter sp. MD2(2019) TaxID=2605273 RepID=UPI002D1F4A4D|nr:class III extradiol ring-cleavage dioxygenase [Acinetobacter sp. MD2(2019)]MEB3753442.1 dioxygenase [Acinetobacter sp. MD2(2019)]
MLNSTTTRQPVYFVSHGGGPWPWMPEQLETVYSVLADALASLLPALVVQPKAILMISAHWEEAEFTVQSAAQPGMIYDYGGFPDYTYQVKYPSQGSPELAERVMTLLQNAQIDVRANATRGYDHGMFSPMQVIHPAADIPVVQLSLKRGLDPQAHIELGRALAPLRDENVLIIGSGLSYHNLSQFNYLASKPSQAFDEWLYDTVVEHQGEQRSALLNDWATAPAARIAHPREEHLLPLMVAVGAAEDELAVRNYHETEFVGGLWVSNFALGM